MTTPTPDRDLTKTAQQLRVIVRLLTHNPDADLEERNHHQLMFWYQKSRNPHRIEPDERAAIEARWGDYGHGELFVPVTLESVGEKYTRNNAMCLQNVMCVARLKWLIRVTELVEFNVRDLSSSPAVLDGRIDPVLRSWIDAQRLRRRAGKLSDARAGFLDSLLPGWCPPARFLSSWDERLSQLESFIEDQGKSPSVNSVSKVERSLAGWLRSQKRRMFLSEDRVHKLETLVPGWRRSRE